MKTLKELVTVPGRTIEYPVIKIDELRQEAIKWIKASDYDFSDQFLDGIRNRFDHENVLLCKEFIKHFFGISKEELA